MALFLDRNFMQIYQKRRFRLQAQLGVDEAVVLFAAPETNGPFRYRPARDWYYLTGWPEAMTIAVILPEHPPGAWWCFSRQSDPQKDVWQGVPIGSQRAQSEFGAIAAFGLDAAMEMLPQILQGKRRIYSNLMDNQDWIELQFKYWLQGCLNSAVTPELCDVGSWLHEMRLIKDEVELQSIRSAAAITVAAHLRALAACYPGRYEYELEAEILHEFVRQGSTGAAFTTVVASGTQSCTLHYSENRQRLRAGDLVIIDAGAEYQYYAADLSRTYPVSGRFTREQQAIYELVLAAQQEIVRNIYPGVSWNKLQIIAELIITTGLRKLGILPDSEEEVALSGGCRPFFMHNFGHWLGLDVHDVGGYRISGSESAWRTLEPGMVLTVEPGIYLHPARAVFSLDERWHYLGVRIEDDYLVTEDGVEHLTAGAPRDPREIEKLMGKLNSECKW